MATTSQIVSVAANVVTAPTPLTLQGNGAFISTAGTTQTSGTWAFYASLTALTAGLASSGGNRTELLAMGTTFFAQNNNIGVYVLELGTQSTPATGIAALTTFIAGNLNQFYAYLVPATWDTAASTMNTLAGLYSTPTSKTYFFVTTSVGTMTAYTAANKAIVATVPSPTAAGTEFQAAALFSEWLANAATPFLTANPMVPMSYRALFGVTPWVLSTGAVNNVSTINSILTLFGNVILTGSEAGNANSLLYKGTTIDGNQMMFWWAVDWFEINSQQRLAAAVVNGSNGAPLPYNQFGINQLNTVLNNLCTTSVADSIMLSASVTAIPFITYTTANQSDYQAGNYAGFQATVTPQNGFLTIKFFITATQFV